jgi:hypothetical protein
VSTDLFEMKECESYTAKEKNSSLRIFESRIGHRYAQNFSINPAQTFPEGRECNCSPCRRNIGFFVSTFATILLTRVISQFVPGLDSDHASRFQLLHLCEALNDDELAERTCTLRLRGCIWTNSLRSAVEGSAGHFPNSSPHGSPLVEAAGSRLLTARVHPGSFVMHHASCIMDGRNTVCGSRWSRTRACD